MALKRICDVCGIDKDVSSKNFPIGTENNSVETVEISEKYDLCVNCYLKILVELLRQTMTTKAIEYDINRIILNIIENFINPHIKKG